MVYLAFAAGAALVCDDVEVDADVVDVDAFSPDLWSWPQPTSAKLSATEMVASVKCFIDPISRKLGQYQR